MCECRVYKQGRYITEIIESRDFDKLVTVVEDLQNQLAHAETESEYYQTILSGRWPDSKEILTEALKKCQEVGSGTQ